MVNINFVGVILALLGSSCCGLCYLQSISVFACVVSICSVSVFAALFFFWFVVSISSAFLYLVVLRVFAA